MQVLDRFANRYIAVARALVVLAGVFVCVNLSAANLAQAADPVAFDHNQTGYPLTGAHLSVACESCHISTSVQATPSRCSGCHNGGIASGKSAGHVPTTAECDNCHTTVTYKNARFDHTGTTGTCTSCHNGKMASGKSANHILTAADCGSCHMTATWKSASVDHAAFTGTCASCHDGKAATGKGLAHINTTDNCVACHSSTVMWTGATMIHAETPILANCSSCHDGGVHDSITIKGTSAFANHVATNGAECSTCHAGTTTFANGKFDHTGNTEPCAKCHVAGGGATAKGPAHIVTSMLCDSCHIGTSVWTTVTADFTVLHQQITNLASCHTCHDNTNHDGVMIKGTLAFKNHLVTTAECSTCHAGNLTFANGKFDHTGNTLPCAQCHVTNGGATAMGPAHIAASQLCDSCHVSTSLWTNITTNLGQLHLQVANLASCHTCHDNTNHDGIVIKGSAAFATHVVTTAECSTCHTGTVTFKNGTFSHAGISTGCVTCHVAGGSAAVAKGTAHILSSTSCESCHIGTTTWTSIVADLNQLHAQVPAAALASCSTCHDNQNHDGTVIKGTQAFATHVPTNGAECSACHTGTVTFKNGTFPHTGITSGCASCHVAGGSAVVAKGSAHIASSAICEGCHLGTAIWTAVTADFGALHLQVSNLASCHTCHDNANHDGVVIKGTLAFKNHLVTTAECSTCHAGNLTFANGIFNHTGSTIPCINCHVTNGGATPVGTGHIPASQVCNTCHIGTTAWTTVTMDHAQTPILSSCHTCHDNTNHDGIVIKGTAAFTNHVAIGSAECTTCHTQTYTSFAGGIFNHPPGTTNCVSCHVAGGSATVAKGPAHIASSTLCDSCHIGTAVWTSVTTNFTTLHAQIPAASLATCSTCHDNANHDGIVIVGTKAFANHVATNGAECSACHTGTITFKNGVFAHTNITAGCVTCHVAGGSAVVAKGPAHIVSSTKCEGCHVGTTVWTSVTTNFTQMHVEIPATTSCSSCHDNASHDGITIIGAKALATHIPIQAGTDCSSCHAGTATFHNGIFNHTGSTITCVTCHVANGGGTAKGPAHIATSTLCDSCHIGTTIWTSVTTNLTQLHGQIPAVATCHTCHDNLVHDSVKIIGMASFPTHVPTTAECSTCHTSFTSFLGATFTHPVVTTGCATCHVTGGSGLPKGPMHITSSAACETCHGTNFTTFVGAKMDHTQTSIEATCHTCHDNLVHDGLQILGMASFPTHVATTAECSTCHKSFTSFLGASFVHPAVTTGCASCHVTGGSGLPKGTAHIVSSAACETCHGTNFTTFIGAKMDHTQTSLLATCHVCHDNLVHDGVQIIGMASFPSHVATTAECSSCHTSYTTFLGATFTHPAGTTNCVKCHTPGGAAVTSKVSPPHMSTTNTCQNCHSSFLVWTGISKPNHSDVVGTCISCHGASAPATLDGISIKRASAGHHPGQDCAGCHSTNSFGG